MSRLMRAAAVTLVGALAATLCSTAVPAAAAATDSVGSIVFVKNHNVWIARGDGTNARALTTDGTAENDYWSPSESDNGMVVAAHGPFVVRMKQTGQVLNRIDTPMLKNSAGENMDGPPSQVSISPDGKTVAWTYARYSCPGGVSCMVRSATGYTLATKLSIVGTPTYYAFPSWVTNSRTLQSGGFGSQMMLQDITAAPRHWFDDSDYASPSTDLSDGEVSPNGRWVAAIRGYDDTTHVIWYAVRGNVRTGTPAVPTWKCFTNDAAGFRSPSWSPTSAALVWEEPDGIWLEPDAAGCANTTLLIPGGSSPDWSKASL